MERRGDYIIISRQMGELMGDMRGITGLLSRLESYMTKRLDDQEVVINNQDERIKTLENRQIWVTGFATAFSSLITIIITQLNTIKIFFGGHS